LQGDGVEVGPGFRLRRASADDHGALSDICLRTGRAGADASGIDDDPTLLGAVYAVPYQIFAPDHAWVIDDGAGACGYVVGTPDTAAFNALCRRDWFPALAARTRDPGTDPTAWRGFDWVRAMIHRPDPSLPPALSPWPGHAHINLLPRVQGAGLGRRAMEHLLAGLRAVSAPGLHLGVHPANLSAQAFYRRLGFSRLDHPDLARGTVFMVRSLDPEAGAEGV
jgi:GNAT superfamily N-acetyltransferase